MLETFLEWNFLKWFEKKQISQNKHDSPTQLCFRAEAELFCTFCIEKSFEPKAALDSRAEAALFCAFYRLIMIEVF